MKIKKLISIIMTMNNNRLDAMTHEEAVLQFMESVNSMYETILEFQKELKDKHLDLNQKRKALPTNTKKIYVFVADEMGNPTCAQVKLYPILEGENPRETNLANGRIDMILRNTDEQGELIIEVPLYEHIGFAQGKIKASKIIGFSVRVSKGSEYEISENFNWLTDKDETIEVPGFQLKRLANIKSFGWVAGDLHHHSIYSSPSYGGTDDVVESAKEVKDSMVSMGLSFGALSDHHNTLNHRDWQKTEDASFLPMVSKEISTSNGHVMALNVDEDVIYAIPEMKERNFDYLYHEFVRVTELIKKSNGLAQINHPRDMNPAISLSSQMTSYIEMFDTMEIWNGSIPFMSGTTNDQAYKLWLELLKSNRFIPATSGSDTHNTRANDYHQLYNELNWFVYQLEKETLCSENKGIAKFVKLFKDSAEMFEKWAEENLGTGGVRTYVYCECLDRESNSSLASHTKKHLEPEVVLKGLKEGKSFLTNGPLLIPEIEGKSIGDTLHIGKRKSILLGIRLIGNKPLEKLTVQSKQGIMETVILRTKDKKSSDRDFAENGSTENGSKVWIKEASYNSNGSFEMKLELCLEVKSLESKDWIIFRAFSDHTNQVITNPIHLTRNEESIV